MPPAGLEALGPGELAEAIDIAERMFGGESLDAFIRRISPDRPPPAHIAPLIRRLDGARSQPIRLCVSMPPRHAKTTSLLHAIPWWLTKFPADTCGYFTYSDKKGWAKSRIARAIAEAADIELSEDAASVAEWRTEEGGGLLAGGAGGGLTGEGVQGLMVVDDPYKNRLEAESPDVRRRIQEWFNEVAFTRDEGMSIVVMHTRWHRYDLIGSLEAQGWEVMRLPAIAEEDDLLGRPVGAALWPERYDVDRLARIEKQLGPFSWAALYQQRPRPRGSRVFGGAHYYDPATVDLNGSKIYIAADPGGIDEAGSYNAAGVGRLVGSDPETWKLYITRGIHDNQVIPDFTLALYQLQHEHGGARIFVEAVGAFKAVPQALRKINPGILLKEIHPMGDKFLRAQAAAAAWNEGRILVPLGAPWVGEFVQELEAFTGLRKGERNDQVDWLAHMWNNLARPTSPGRSRVGASPRRI